MLYALTQGVLSAWRAIFPSVRCLDKHSLTLVQVPLWQSRPSGCYQGIVVFNSFRLKPSVLKNHNLGLGRCSPDKSSMSSRILSVVSKADVPTAAKVSASAIDGISARQKKLFWDAQRSLCPIQSFPTSITHFLSNCFNDSFSMRWGRLSCYQSGQESDERGYTQWLWTFCCLYTVEKNLWPWRSRWFDIVRLALEFLLQNRLGTVWQSATTIALWYSLTSAIDRTLHWHMVSVSWWLQGTHFNYGLISVMRKSWIWITFITISRMCHPRSVLCDTLTMVGIFLAVKP